MTTFATFEARATEAGAEVSRVSTREQALEEIERQLLAEGVAERALGAATTPVPNGAVRRPYVSWRRAVIPPRSAVWAPCPFLDGIDRAALLTRVPGLSLEVTLARAADARVGISQVDWAVADTGSIAQDATAVAQRLVSTLPATHIALVPGDRIVPDLATYLSRQRPADSNYLSLITGPSRTADIERVLTIGVHGPARLVVIVVDDLEGV